MRFENTKKVREGEIERDREREGWRERDHVAWYYKESKKNITESDVNIR